MSGRPFTPASADETDPLEHGLVTLTEAIHQLDPDSVAHGFLGGEFGYGARYENEVFLMHPYCWCEADDCRWCSEDACGCAHRSPTHLIDGRLVSSDEFWSWNRALLGKMPHEVADHGTPAYITASVEWDRKVAERDNRHKTVWPSRIHTCEPKGMMADRLEGNTWKPRQSAPNFWHKPSGLHVWWYKWIGRDMDVAGGDGDYQAVFSGCLASLNSSPPPR